MGEVSARVVVYSRSGGRCELCGARAGEWSHRRARSQGGPWAPSNGLHLCRDCHAWLEANPAAADAGGWRLVHRDVAASTVPVWLFGVLCVRGWSLLDDDGSVLYVDWVDEGLPRCPVLPGWVA